MGFDGIYSAESSTGQYNTILRKPTAEETSLETRIKNENNLYDKKLSLSGNGIIYF